MIGIDLDTMSTEELKDALEKLRGHRSRNTQKGVKKTREKRSSSASSIPKKKLTDEEKIAEKEAKGVVFMEV